MQNVRDTYNIGKNFRISKLGNFLVTNPYKKNSLIDFFLRLETLVNLVFCQRGSEYKRKMYPNHDPYSRNSKK